MKSGRFFKGWLLFALMQGLLVTLFSSSAVQAEDIYDQVKSDIRAERSQAALKTLRSMVKERPDDFHAWFLYGVANAHLNQYHRAIEAFRHVIDLNPKLAEPHDNLAVIYNELGDVPAAVHELEQSLVKRPDNPVAEENLADLYVKMAIKRYRSALAMVPNRQLEKRYARLLQVRDPDVTSVHEGQTVISMPVEMARNQRDSDASVDTRSIEQVSLPAEVKIPEPVVEEGVAEKDVEVAESQSAKDVVITTPTEPDQSIALLERQVLDAVEAWRTAWSARSLSDYFAAYAEDFQVPDRFQSRDEWQAYKQRVISSKTFIKIELDSVKVELKQGGKGARVNFFQKFRSNSYNGSDSKVLDMRLDDGTWKIVREDSVS